jgi:hypothetical protein
LPDIADCKSTVIAPVDLTKIKFSRFLALICCTATKSACNATGLPYNSFHAALQQNSFGADTVKFIFVFTLT